MIFCKVIGPYQPLASLTIILDKCLNETTSRIFAAQQERFLSLYLLPPFSPYAVYVFKDDINNYPLLFRDLGRR